MSQPRKVKREAEILRLLWSGRSVGRVARQFDLSPTRIRFIRERALYEQQEMLEHGEPFFTVR